MTDVRQFSVSETDEIVRLDKFLSSKMPEFSRSEIQKFNVTRINGTDVKFSEKVRIGDEFIVKIPEQKSDIAIENVTADFDLDILYEDDDIIVINKPRGVVMYPSAGNKTGTLVQNILSHTNLSMLGGDVRPGVVHRLDKDTSGVMVFAKTSKALERLNDMFRVGSVKKIYWAITKERPTQPEAELECWILRNEKMNKSFSYPKEVKGSKHALLYYRHIAASQNYNLIEVELKTGRHHQIRCQLAKIGCPIKGDLKYGFPRSNSDGGISLHARSIEFVHPVSKELIKVVAPVPNDNLWKEFEAMVEKDEEKA